MADAIASIAIDREFLQDFTERWQRAWNDHDPDAVAALCTEDVEFFDPAIGTVRGRAAVADWVRACVLAFPDYRFTEPEPPYLAEDGSKAIMPWLMTGTHTGPIEPPGFAPTHRSFELSGVDHWEFRDGLVARYRADYDSMGLARDLGLVPPRGSRAERAMVRLQRAGARLRRPR